MGGPEDLRSWGPEAREKNKDLRNLASRPQDLKTSVLPPSSLPRLTLLVADQTGYRNLCRLLTTAARGRPKGEAQVDLDLIAEHAGGLHCLTGGDEGLLARLLEDNDRAGARALIDRLSAIFPKRLHIEIQRHHRRSEEACNRGRIELANQFRVPLLATNGVRYARSEDKNLHDVFTALRHRTDLDTAGRLLVAHRECHVKGATQMAELFADLPHALAATTELAEQLDFTLANLGYRFPDLSVAARRDYDLVSAPDHLERGPGSFPPAHRTRPDPDFQRTGNDRETRSRRLLPDRLGHRAVLQTRANHGPGPRLGGQQRRLLRAVDHRGRSGQDGTCCSSVSSPRSAASGRTSISICHPAISAKRSSSTCTSATARTARR